MPSVPNLPEITQRRISLGGAPVDLWYGSLKSNQNPEYQTLLSPDERARAQRYLSDAVREDFITGRALLRKILGEHYLQIPPQSVRFIYGERGRPTLDHPDKTLRFNVSHSHDCWLLAVTMGREIGLDVEYTHGKTDLVLIARQFFSPQEYTTFQNAPDDEKSCVFYNCWTRKEAYIKARGDGLAIPLSSFVVSMLPDDIPRLLHAEDDDPARWLCHTERIMNDYIMSVIVERLPL